MGGQKYKIYVNGTPLFLTTRAGAAETGIQPGKNAHVAMYAGKPRFIKQYLDLLEKNNRIEAVVLWSEDLAGLWADFQSCFKLVEAAGGYVENERGELLVMFRRGSWDLPKGKIDDGETPPQAAVREVQEETGLTDVRLGAFICETWHTYLFKEKRWLKKTYWYRMQTTDNQTVPQTEEDIEAIEWVDAAAWLASGPVVYGSIRDVIVGVLATADSDK